MDSRTRFLKACRGEAVDRPPVWFMRQAGRYLPEYRNHRAKHEFLEVCHTPELAAEVTMMPVNRFAVDAAIIFSDILVIPEAMGLDVTYPPGGPVIKPEIETAAHVDALETPVVAEKLAYVGEALKETRKRLGDDKALIGFSGSPFTIACYMMPKMGKDRSMGARILMKRDPALFDVLMDRLADIVVDYLKMQIASGADAVQLFDTWAGEVTPVEYERHILPCHKKIMDSLADEGVPRILYVNGVCGVLEMMAAAEPEVIGVDWRMRLFEARRRVGEKFALQGNMDPFALYASPEHIRGEVRRMIDETGGRGHIVNLGHGITPDAPVEGVEAFIDAVVNAELPKSL